MGIDAHKVTNLFAFALKVHDAPELDRAKNKLLFTLMAFVYLFLLFIEIDDSHR